MGLFRFACYLPRSRCFSLCLYLVEFRVCWFSNTLPVERRHVDWGRVFVSGKQRYTTILDKALVINGKRELFGSVCKTSNVSQGKSAERATRESRHGCAGSTSKPWSNNSSCGTRRLRVMRAWIAAARDRKQGGNGGNDCKAGSRSQSSSGRR